MSDKVIGTSREMALKAAGSGRPLDVYASFMNSGNPNGRQHYETRLADNTPQILSQEQLRGTKPGSPVKANANVGTKVTTETNSNTINPINTSYNANQPTQASQVQRFSYAPNVNTSWYRQNLQPIQTTQNQFDKFKGYSNYSNYSPQQSLLALLQNLGIGGGQPEGIGGGGTGGSDITFEEYDANIDAYIDELIAEAQGRRDLIAKQLEAEHQLALGTDDEARAEFMEKVASKLEERIGRIPYDYEKYTTRELEDFARNTERLSESKDTALGRLYEDERLQGEDLTRQADDAREQQGVSMTERGLLEGTREDAQGMVGEQVQDLEGDVQRQFEALARATGRSEYDTNLGFNQGIEDAVTNRDRNLSDITTTARRGAIDAEQAKQFGIENADFNLQSDLKKLERQKNMYKASSVGDYASRLPS